MRAGGRLIAPDLPQPNPTKYVRREFDVQAREYYRRLARGQLATTFCTGCGQTTFPPRRYCLRCAREQVWIGLPLHGTLHAFTTQETALRFSTPAVLALAELGDAIVPGICEGRHESLAIGQPILVEIRAEPETGLKLLAFIPKRPSSRS